jgi:hypothetical protein
MTIISTLGDLEQPPARHRSVSPTARRLVRHEPRPKIEAVNWLFRCKSRDRLRCITGRDASNAVSAKELEQAKTAPVSLVRTAIPSLPLARGRCHMRFFRA